MLLLKSILNEQRSSWSLVIFSVLSSVPDAGVRSFNTVLTWHHTDLRRRQSTSTLRAVGEHPADVLCATLTFRRWSVSAPVASVEHLPGGVGDLWPHEQASPLDLTLTTPAGRTGSECKGLWFKHWDAVWVSGIKNGVLNYYKNLKRYTGFPKARNVCLLR